MNSILDAHRHRSVLQYQNKQLRCPSRLKQPHSLSFALGHSRELQPMKPEIRPSDNRKSVHNLLPTLKSQQKLRKNIQKVRASFMCYQFTNFLLGEKTQRFQPQAPHRPNTATSNSSDQNTDIEHGESAYTGMRTS